jgi:hypothetical protein
MTNRTAKITAWFDDETNEWLARKSINGHIVKMVSGFSTKEEAENAASN